MTRYIKYIAICITAVLLSCRYADAGERKTHYEGSVSAGASFERNFGYGASLYTSHGVKYNRRVYRFLQYLVHPPVYLDVFCSFWDIFATRVPEEPTKTVHSGGKSKPGACGQALHQPWSGEFDDGDAGAAAFDVLVGE